MSKKIVLLTLFLVFLLFAMVATASAQTRKVGVLEGDQFIYDDLLVDWNSTDPTAKPDPFVEVLNETELYNLTVLGIVDKNITLRMIQQLKNGTIYYGIGYIDIDTGTASENANLTVISADLNAGHTLYSSVEYSTWTINETIVSIYPGGGRLTNHINMTFRQTFGAAEYNGSTNYYWDRETGILVEMSGKQINWTGVYLTNSSYSIRITASNRWVIPEFPTLTSILILSVALSFVILIYKRRLPKTLIH